MIIKTLEEQISTILLKYSFDTDDDVCYRLLFEIAPLTGNYRNLLVLFHSNENALSVSYDTDNAFRKMLVLSEGKVVEINESDNRRSSL